MKQELEPIGRSVVFSPGVRVTRVALTWDRDPTPEELDSDDYTLQRCEGSLGWWMGDLICKRIEMTLKARAVASGGKPEFFTNDERIGYLTQFAREYAAPRITLSESTTIARTHLAAFFPPLSRLSELSWSHHYEAYCLLSGQGIDLALEWLRRAHEGEWSVAKLRAELRMFTAAPSTNQTPANDAGAPPAEVVDVERWASTEWPQIKRAGHQHASWLLSQMPMTVRAIDHLRSVVVASAGEG